jgi:hypothetical protein
MFFKNLFAKNLHKNALKKQLKDWYSIIWVLKKEAEAKSKLGFFSVTFDGNRLKCEYNKTRTQEQIVDDIKKHFSGCSVTHGLNSYSQFVVDISWKK